MLPPWFFIASGVAFGLVPPHFFYGSSWRHVTLIDATTSGHLGRDGNHRTGMASKLWWRLPLLWIDPIRGFFCAYLIAWGLYKMPIESTEQIAIILGIKCFCTLVALAVQMEFGRQRKKDMMSPLPFLIGFLIGISYGSWLLGCSAALICLMACIGTRSFKMGYLIAGVVGGILSYPTLGLSANLGIFALTIMAPVPYAFLRGARLVFPFRSK
jgi:hypothetical protein